MPRWSTPEHPGVPARITTREDGRRQPPPARKETPRRALHCCSAGSSGWLCQAQAATLRPVVAVLVVVELSEA